MPHDKNNAVIEVGDYIKAPAMNGTGMHVGRVITVYADIQRCTGNMQFMVFGGCSQSMFHADEAEIICKAKDMAGDWS